MDAEAEVDEETALLSYSFISFKLSRAVLPRPSSAGAFFAALTAVIRIRIAARSRVIAATVTRGPVRVVVARALIAPVGSTGSGKIIVRFRLRVKTVLVVVVLLRWLLTLKPDTIRVVLLAQRGGNKATRAAR